MTGYRIGRLAPGWVACRGRAGRLAVAAWCALLPACESGAQSDDGAATEDPAAERSAAPPRARLDLGAALAYARGIELPDELEFVDFRQAGAVFSASGAGTYVETVKARVFEESGDSAYWLDLTIEHQSEPISFHARGSVGGTGGVWGVAAELKKMAADLPIDIAAAAGLPDRIEVVRLGDDYWTRSPDWSGPKAVDYVMYLNREAPAHRVSTAFGWMLWTPGVTAEERVTMAGLEVAHYRLIDDRNRLAALWNAMAAELPNEPMPPDAKGEMDIWLMDNGLVVRARLRATDSLGRVFTGELDLGELGGVVEVRAPT